MFQRENLAAACASSASAAAFSSAHAALGGMSEEEMADRDIDLGELAAAMVLLKKRQAEDRIEVLTKELTHLLASARQSDNNTDTRSNTVVMSDASTPASGREQQVTVSTAGYLAAALTAAATNGAVDWNLSSNLLDGPLDGTEHIAASTAAASVGGSFASSSVSGSSAHLDSVRGSPYAWKQDRHSVTVTVPVPSGLKSKHVQVTVSSGRLTVTLTPPQSVFQQMAQPEASSAAAAAAAAAASGSGSVSSGGLSSSAAPLEWFSGHFAYPFIVDTDGGNTSKCKGTADGSGDDVSSFFPLMDGLSNESEGGAGVLAPSNPLDGLSAASSAPLAGTAAAAAAALRPTFKTADIDHAWTLEDFNLDLNNTTTDSTPSTTATVNASLTAVNSATVAKAETALAALPFALEQPSQSESLSKGSQSANGRMRAVVVTVSKVPPPGLIMWWQRAFVGGASVPLAQSNANAHTGTARIMSSNMDDGHNAEAEADSTATGGIVGRVPGGAVSAALSNAASSASGQGVWAQAHRMFLEQVKQRKRLLVDDKGNIVGQEESDDEQQKK